MHAFLGGRLPFMGIPAVIDLTPSGSQPAVVHSLEDLDQADGDARAIARRTWRRSSMRWLMALLGFAALIVLHELGHFAPAKLVGMRVERFVLFFDAATGR